MNDPTESGMLSSKPGPKRTGPRNSRGDSDNGCPQKQELRGGRYAPPHLIPRTPRQLPPFTGPGHPRHHATANPPEIAGCPCSVPCHGRAAARPCSRSYGDLSRPPWRVRTSCSSSSTRADIPFEPYGGGARHDTAMKSTTSAATARARTLFSRRNVMDECCLRRCSPVSCRAAPAWATSAAAPTRSSRVECELGPQLLPSVLRQHGYRTSGVSANLWVSEQSGFDEGFDSFRYLKSRRNHKIDSKRAIDKLQWYLEAARASVDDGASAVVALLDEWSSSRHREPFFWFVNLVECHSPYLPPRPFNNQSLRGRLQARRRKRGNSDPVSDLAVLRR